MKLSVIITNYNKMPLTTYLIKYFNRVKRPDVEVLCIDDHSEIVPKDLGDVKLTVNLQNFGIGRVRQQGLESSCGDYVVFVDSDDLVTEDYLDTILAALESGLDVYEFLGISYPGGEFDNFNGMPARGEVWNKVYSRDFILKNNLKFDDIRCEEDLAFNEAFYAHNPAIGQIDKVLYIYNMLTAGMTYPGHLRQINLFD